MADPRISEEKGTKAAQREISEQKFNEEFRKSLAARFGPSAILEVKEMLTSMKDLAAHPVDSLYSFGQYLSENPIKASIEVGKAMLAVTDIQTAQKAIEKARQTGTRKDLNAAAELTCKAFTSFVLTYGTLAVGGAAATKAGKIAKAGKTAKAAKAAPDAIKEFKEIAKKTADLAKKSKAEEASLMPAIPKTPSGASLKQPTQVAKLEPAILKSSIPETSFIPVKTESGAYASKSAATAVKVAETAVYEGPSVKEFNKLFNDLRSLKLKQTSGPAGLKVSNEMQGVYHILESNFEKITLKLPPKKMEFVKEFKFEETFAAKLARQSDPKKTATLLLNEPKIMIEKVLSNPVRNNAGVANIKIEGIGDPMLCRAKFIERSGRVVYELYQ